MSFASLRLRANKQQGFRFARRREDAKKGLERSEAMTIQPNVILP